jgi:hypothetical protein
VVERLLFEVVSDVSDVDADTDVDADANADADING